MENGSRQSVMNGVHEFDQISVRLGRIRQTVRRRLVAFGVFAVIAGGAVSLLTIVLLDWLLWLPPALRIFGLLLFVGGFVGATYHWVVQPLRAPLGIDEIAGTLEECFPALRDRLSSTVNFLRRFREGASNDLMQEVIARTDEVLDRVPLERALASGPVAVRGALCALSCGVLAVVVLLAPGWLSLGIGRYVRPWGQTQWPTRVAIRPITSELVAGTGESVILRMKVVRGLEDDLRGVAKLVATDGSETSLAMNRDSEGNYWTTVESITQELAYWFEAGDSSTRTNPGIIRVIQRPQVVQALVTIHAPRYAIERGSRVVDLGEGPVEVTQGCRMTVHLKTNKPVSSDGQGVAQGLRFQDGTFVPLHLEEGALTGSFDADGEMQFRAELLDTQGFENRRSRTYVVVATPDRAPTVTLLHPVSAIDVTPEAVVHVSVRVEDDYGITGVRIVPDPERFDKAVTLSFHQVADPLSGGSEVAVRAERDWELRSMALSVGDTVSYYVEATDNRSLENRGTQVGRSSQMLLHVVSATEMETHAREDMLALEARVRSVAMEQARLHDQTESLESDPSRQVALTQKQREQCALLAGDQARLGRTTEKIAARMAEIGEQLRRNRVGDPKTVDRVGDMAKTLHRVVTGPVEDSTFSLGKVAQKGDADSQQEELKYAASSQSKTLDALYGLLREMSQWGSFQGVVTRTRQLLDRQTKLRNQTLKLGREMLGKSVASLSEKEQARLKRAMREQHQLGSDIEQHLANLQSMRDRVRSKDVAGADAIEQALREAHAREIKRRLESAARAVGQNRTAGAAIEQRAVVEALRKMVAALRERESRELAELRKRLESAEQRVAELLADQVAIRDATHENSLVESGGAQASSLREAQGSVAQNAGLLAQELLEVDRAIATARLVVRATGPMHEAEEFLAQGDVNQALVPQDKAVALLEKALHDLQEAARRAAEQEMRRSLAQIEEDLSAILTVERGVSEGTKKLVALVHDSGRIRRAQSREASRLGREQSKARLMVQELSPDFEKVPVYGWAMERIATWMDSSSSALEARRLDEALVVTTARIVSELEKLVGALVQTRKLPWGTEFAEAERQGGGAAGESSETKPVPAVAELLVLKAMQLDINRRTKAFREGYDPTDATEDQLRELLVIGEDQAEVARLTRRVTEQAER